MKILLLIPIFSFFTCISLYAQDPQRNYTQYGVENGLAGSTVYCMLQDHDGFMWFGTETGISRFDGTRFKNFGTADGLPDNEILEMFIDSKGRIWMSPFKKTVCYYYKGKIYNSENDPVLKSIAPKGYVMKFAEDANGDILLHEPSRLQLISGNKVERIDSLRGLPLQFFHGISEASNGGFMVIYGNKLYELKNKEFHFKTEVRIPYPNYVFATLNKDVVVTRASFNSLEIINLQTGIREYAPFATEQFTMQLLGDSLFVSNTQRGCFFYYLNSHRPPEWFMQNTAVSKAFIDKDGNFWFSTLGQGVFRLASENMKGMELKNEFGNKLSVFSIYARPGKWIVGTNMLRIFEITHTNSPSPKKRIIWNEWDNTGHARVTAIEVLGNNKYLFGSDEIMETFPREKLDLRKIISPIKAIYLKSDSDVYVATSGGVIRVSIPEFKVTDTIWDERATTVYERGDTIYVGTLDGLSMVLKNKSVVFVGEKEPLLKNRINDIKESREGLLWIATNGGGLIALKNGKVEWKISKSDGLTSDICRTLFVKANEVWVGTDKGLNRIVFSPKGYQISKFTRGDGLSSNIINAVALDSNIVIIGTPEGINYFNIDSVSFRSAINLVIDDVLVSDRHIELSARSIILPHKNNNIRFEFAGISFRSSGEITYKYRLVGLDTAWKTTQDNFLSYPTLPSGQYKLELQAINKFGFQSRMLSVPFTIEELLVEKTWFRSLVFATLLIFTFLFVYWLIRRVRRRDMEKNDIRRRIAELEQLALKSQMNPHFIFNCLNSIQQFVLDKDVEGSNRFITGFSRLIRQTLDISAKREIPLSEEIIYLSTYLELEKTRFENKFTYEIRVADGLNAEQVYVPPMMLQPFVENSIRHGIRYRTDSSGKIVVSFARTDHELTCSVEDNGVGREASRLFKSNNPIEYQSKGMKLIADRVEFLNMHSANPITISIEDLTDESENPTGTRVTMKFPLEYGD